MDRWHEHNRGQLLRPRHVALAAHRSYQQELIKVSMLRADYRRWNGQGGCCLSPTPPCPCTPIPSSTPRQSPCPHFSTCVCALGPTDIPSPTHTCPCPYSSFQPPECPVCHGRQICQSHVVLCRLWRNFNPYGPFKTPRVRFIQPDRSGSGEQPPSHSPSPSLPSP